MKGIAAIEGYKRVCNFNTSLGNSRAIKVLDKPCSDSKACTTVDIKEGLCFAMLVNDVITAIKLTLLNDKKRSYSNSLQSNDKRSMDTFVPYRLEFALIRIAYKTKNQLF